MYVLSFTGVAAAQFVYKGLQSVMHSLYVFPLWLYKKKRSLPNNLYTTYNMIFMQIDLFL